MAIKVVSSREMRSIEAAADQLGLSYASMMDNAGQRVAQAVDEHIGAEAILALVLVGPGNNGGDGLVVARRLLEMGADVFVYVWKRDIHGDQNWDAVRQVGVPHSSLAEDSGLQQLQAQLDQADVVIDALLGTGFSGSIKGDLKNLLDTARRVVARRRHPDDGDLCSPAGRTTDRTWPQVVAVDVPSGLNSDTGAYDPATLPADLTVTLAAVKRGHVYPAAASIVGELVVADIGIQEEILFGLPIEMASLGMVTDLLSGLPSAAALEDGRRRSLIVAGSINTPGAIVVAGRAAARTTPGTVTLALPQPIYAIAAEHLTESAFVLLPHDMGVLASGAVKVLLENLEGQAGLLVGPGLGTETQTRDFLFQLLGSESTSGRRRVGFLADEVSIEKPHKPQLPPLIVCGDGVDLIAEREHWWQMLPAETILLLTPSQIARATGCQTQEDPVDRIDCLQDLSSRWGLPLVMTGLYSLVAAPDGRVTVLPFASSALAAPGNEHVLAGIVLGLRAWGLAPFDAAVAGCYLHGLSARLAGQLGLGARGAIGDLLAALPAALAHARPASIP